MLNNIGTGEVLIISVVVLMLFGSKKLNELARGLGKSSREYKKVKKELTDAVNVYEDDLVTESSNKDNKVDAPAPKKEEADVLGAQKEENEEEGGDE